MKPHINIGISHSGDLLIPFDALMLSAVVQEFSNLLLGGKIQDIRQPEPGELQFGIHTKSGTLRLRVSIDPRFARIHLVTQKAANSAIPSEFCSALRRHIEGGRVQSVTQVGVDRIAKIRVESDLGDGKKAYSSIIVELMGKHSNIILVDDHGRIIECAKRVSHRINRIRETLPGLTYTQPPGVLDGPLPSPGEFAESVAQAVGDNATVNAIEVAIRKHTPFVSPFLAAEIALRCTIQDREIEPYRLAFGSAISGQAAGTLHERLCAVFETLYSRRAYQPVTAAASRGAGAYPIPLLQISADQQSPTAGLNDALDIGYANSLRSVHKLDAVDRLSSEIARELEKQSHTASSLIRSIDEASRADLLTQSGDLLLANLWQIKPGQPEISVADYYSNAGDNRAIKLNPQLSPQENAETYFDRARRARQGLETARTRLEKTSAAINSLTEAATNLRAVNEDPNADSSQVHELGEILLREGLLRKPANIGPREVPQFQGHRIRRETTPEGFEILVGESATANDFLTTRIARPDDLWLHVRSVTGGHVVIRTQGKPDTVPDRVLERAATIAALHSAQKHSSLIAVDYTLKKYVRKPRGAAPGAVVIEREKTIHVSPGVVVGKY